MAYGSGGNIDIAVQLRFLDQFTQHVNAPIAATNRLKQAIDSTAAVASRSQAAMARLGAAYDNLAGRAERSHARMMALRGRALGVAASAVGLALPIAASANYELLLTRFGQIAGWGSGNMRANTLGIDRVMSEVSAATRQSTTDLLKAASQIVSIAGNVFSDSSGNLDLQKLTQTMTVLGRVATATGTSMDDLANSTAAMLKNAGLSASVLEQAYDIIAQAGKMGGFELKDAARWFPSLLSSYSQLFDQYIATSTTGMSPVQTQAFKDRLGLGMIGNLASYLQFARLGAADANIAANNLMNVIQKMFIEETAKHYQKELGIDFRQMIITEARAGRDPISAVVASVADYITKHDNNPLMLGKLFADRQALEGLMPLVRMYMQNRGEMNRFMDAVRSASGVINTDFGTSLGLLRLELGSIA